MHTADGLVKTTLAGQTVRALGAVTTQLVDALATHGPLRLAEYLHRAAVGQLHPPFGWSARHDAAQHRSAEQLAKISVHLAGLLEAPAEDPHLHAGLEQQVQQRRDRP